MSRNERELDRLKMNPGGATKEAPICAMSMPAPQTSSLWQGVGEVSSAGEVGCWRRVQGPTKAAFRRRKNNSIICKFQGCGSNSEVLIRPSNSDVSAQLWERISGWRRVWEKHTIEGPKSLIYRRPYTHARTHWGPNAQKLTFTHMHAVWLFVLLGFEDPSNHWTKRMVNTRLATQDPRTCPGPEDRSIT